MTSGESGQGPSALGGYVLGVDLGTTFTAAAVCRPGGRPEMVSLGSSGFGVPSVLVLKEDGTFLVGEHAEMRAAADPTRVARFFKRQLGDGSTRIVGGTPFSPQSLTSWLLAWVLEVVTARMGSAPARVVLTHPANWGPYRREIFEEAAKAAGVQNLALCSEPEAAAINYASSEKVEEGELLGIYDLGGGTFDAVIMRRSGDGFEVVGHPRGVERLGGIDFDDAVWALVAEACDLDVGAVAEDPEFIAAGYRLRNDCTSAKRLLSADTSADIRVSLPGVTRSVRITRAEFEQRIRPRLTETLTAFESALTSGGTQAESLGRILLVGGSSRVPLASQLLGATFGRPIAVDTDPKNTVALGAALSGTLGGSTAPLPSEQRPADLDIRTLTDLAPGPPPEPLTTVDLRQGSEAPQPDRAPSRLVGTPSDAPTPTSWPAPTTLAVSSPAPPPMGEIVAPTPVAPDEPTPAPAPAPPPAQPPAAPPESELASVMSESRHRASIPLAPHRPVGPEATPISTSVAPTAAGRRMVVLAILAIVAILTVVTVIITHLP